MTIKARRPTAATRYFDGTSVSVAITLALGIWLVVSLGIFRAIDAMAYDACVRLTNRIHQIPARVLLVYIDDTTGSQPAALEKLSDKLLQLGARSQGFAFPLARVSDGLQARAASGQVVLPVVASTGMAAPAPSAAPIDRELSAIGSREPGCVGTLTLYPGEQGVYRHFTAWTDGQPSSPTLEATLAQRALLNGSQLPAGRFRLNYRGGPGSLPSVDGRQVMSDELVPEFVTGKVALIGLYPDPATPGLAAPTSSDAPLFSLLEYHGHALNTLLTESAVGELGSTGTMVLLLAVGLLGSMFSQRFPFRYAAAITAGGMGITALLVLALLAYGRFWLPLSTLLISQGVCFGAVFGLRLSHSNRAVSDMASDQWRRIRRRRWPSDFFSTDETWEQLVLFAYQMFYLDRLVILEILPGNDSLQVVKQVNCDEEDISERRRDCRRWPFSAATDVRGPFRLDDSGRWFFKPSGPEHQQYLVPLLFGGEIYGYLALEVATSYLAQFDDFLPRLQEFSDEVAGLLYRRRCFQSTAASAASSPLLGSAPEQTAFAELQQANLMLERRLARLEDVFDNSANASAVFDVFGQPLLMNSRLLQLLQKKGIVATDTTAVDLLAVLTGRDLNSCRRRLRQVIIDKQTSTSAVSLDGISGLFQLHIRPVRIASQAVDGAAQEADPFQIQCIHCELVDGTTFLQLHSPKDRIAEHLCQALSHELTTVNQAAERLASDLSEKDYVRYGAPIADHLHDAAEILHDCQTFLSGDIFGCPGDGVPVQPEGALREAVSNCGESIRGRNLDVQLQIASPPAEVLANPQRLQELFEALIDALVSNAANHSQLAIQVEQGIHRVDFTFRAQSQSQPQFAGTTGEQLPDGESPAVLKVSQQVEEVRSWLEHWGGALTIHCNHASQEMFARLTLHAYALRKPGTPRGIGGAGRSPALAKAIHE
jgi:CHASE2 domain-containing sensor protein